MNKMIKKILLTGIILTAPSSMLFPKKEEDNKNIEYEPEITDLNKYEFRTTPLRNSSLMDESSYYIDTIDTTVKNTKINLTSEQVNEIRASDSYNKTLNALNTNYEVPSMFIFPNFVQEHGPIMEKLNYLHSELNKHDGKLTFDPVENQNIRAKASEAAAITLALFDHYQALAVKKDTIEYIKREVEKDIKKYT